VIIVLYPDATVLADDLVDEQVENAHLESGGPTHG
jgi:hypothetical protein